MKKNLLSCFLLLVLFFAVAVFIGCSPKADFPIEMVEGIITLDGNPVDGATVGFSPADGTTGKPAVGRTDASGKYVLTASQGGQFGKGTAAGRYNVSVSKSKPERELTGAELKKADETGVMPNIAIIDIVPKKYGDPKNSGLKADVKKRKNNFNFELDSKAK
jgi:hypothetical protein